MHAYLHRKEGDQGNAGSFGITGLEYSDVVDLNASGDKRMPFQFTGSQQLIHSSLHQKGHGLADLYEAALRVNLDRYPAYLILAAHSLRELVDGLPEALDLPIPVDPGLITERMNSLEPVWSNALNSGCHQKGEWTGTIDMPLRKLLQKLNDFFEWFRIKRPARRGMAIQMFRAADPFGQPLPETLEQQRAEAWQQLRRYFNNTAHGKTTTGDEFAAKLDALERILLESLCRRPSEDLSEIDRILNEGASDV